MAECTKKKHRFTGLAFGMYMLCNNYVAIIQEV